MLGLYIQKDVPFDNVYLHALVRDENGDKMSKSKGNIIDPLEMISKYGADALRFTLAAFTSQGRDIKMSEKRIEGYRHFVNKIWNATRFSLINLEDYNEGDIDLKGDDYSLCDRWIMSRLNRMTADVTRCIDEYKFNDAAGKVYQFVWHELCDWYLEMAKPVLYGKGEPTRRQAAQKTLFMVITNSIKILHPFMPFVTEEIWQTLTKDEGSIMVSTFPVEDEDLRDEEAEKKMELIMSVIGAIRNIRGVMHIPPSRKLKVLLSISDEGLIPEIADGKDYICDLANLEELSIRGRVEEPDGVATGVVCPINIFVFLEGIIDVKVEKARLEKELTKIEKDINFLSRKLDNSDFMEKASKEIIEKEQSRFEESKDKRVILEEAFKRVAVIKG